LTRVRSWEDESLLSEDLRKKIVAAIERGKPRHKVCNA